MRLWAKIYDPTFTSVVSDGQIPLVSFSITRGLDRLTRVSAEVPGSMKRQLQYVDSRRIMDVYVQPNTPSHMPAVAKRSLGQYIIDDISTSMDSGGLKRSIQGMEMMMTLKEKIAYPGLVYDDNTLEEVFNGASSPVGLAQLGGWAADVDSGIASNQVSVRFDGANLFKGMQVVAQAQGIHFRSSGTLQQIEVGAFGDTLLKASGEEVVIAYIEGDTSPELAPMVIKRLEIAKSAKSGDMFNYALGFGAGQGDARLSMEKSERAFVSEVTNAQGTFWVVKNNVSIAQYGQIEKPVTVGRLAPVGTSEAQQVNAANALADAIKATVDRHAYPQEVFRVTVRNVDTVIRPGDKVRMMFQGQVYKDGLSAPYSWRDINAQFWVISVTTTIGADGIELQLELSTVDRYEQNAAEILVGVMDSVDVQNVGVQPYPTQRFWQFQRPVDTSTPLDMSFQIFDDVIRLVAVKAIILRSAWTAVAGVASESGDHKHLVAEHITTDFTVAPCAVDAGTHAGTATLTYATYRYASDDDAENTDTEDMSIIVGPGSQYPWYTKNGSGDHTHPTEFSEVQQDTVVPQDCSLVVNGELVSSGFFPAQSGDDFVEIDITEEVLNKAGGWRGFHDLTIDCGTERGDLQVTLYIDVEIGTVRT